jgi:branched-chain amino acid transport system permease protein
MNWTPNPRLSRALWAGGLVLLVAFPFYADAYSVTTLIRVFYFGLLAVSTGFLIGQGGMVSLGQVAFSGVAGYTIGLFAYEREMPFVLAILLAFAAVVVVSFAFGLVAMRTHGLVFLMITLAFGQICWAFAQQNTSLLHGWAGIRGIRPPTVLGIDFKSTQNFYLAALVVFALALLLLHRITRSRFGLALNGVRESPRRMAALGYPVYWIRVTSFVLAALYAGAGGILATYSTGIITPTSLQLSRTIWVLLMVILGGAAYFWGPVVGTVVAVGLDVLISQYSERYNLVIGVIFLLVILFAPNGILGGLARLTSKRPRTAILATEAAVPATEGSGVSAES